MRQGYISRDINFAKLLRTILQIKSFNKTKIKTCYHIIIIRSSTSFLTVQSARSHLPDAPSSNESYYFVTTSDGELQLKAQKPTPKLQQQPAKKKKPRNVTPAIKPSYGGTSGVTGFDFPLIDQEDIERLENTVAQSNEIRGQYINFLARKKSPAMNLVQFLPAIFSDEALDGYNYNGSNTLGKTKLPMRGYDIFSHCFLEAFGDRDGLDMTELASQLSAAIKQSRNRMRQRTFRAKKSIQKLLDTKANDVE